MKESRKYRESRKEREREREREEIDLEIWRKFENILEKQIEERRKLKCGGNNYLETRGRKKTEI